MQEDKNLSNISINLNYKQLIYNYALNVEMPQIYINCRIFILIEEFF